MLSRIGSRIEIPRPGVSLLTCADALDTDGRTEWWGKPYPRGGATPCDLCGCHRQTRGMALDSAPPVLDPPAGDDVARLRRMAQRQWAARRDLERRLHDGAALRVSALTLRLGLLSGTCTADEAQDLRAAVEGLQDELHLVLQELRDIAGRLYPPLLDEAGLGPALREAAGRVRGAGAGSTRPTSGSARPSRGPPTSRCSACLPDGDRAAPVEVVIRREGDDAPSCSSRASTPAMLAPSTTASACSAAPLRWATSRGTAMPLITVRIPCA